MFIEISYNCEEIEPFYMYEYQKKINLILFEYYLLGHDSNIFDQLYGKSKIQFALNCLKSKSK